MAARAPARGRGQALEPAPASAPGGIPGAEAPWVADPTPG